VPDEWGSPSWPSDSSSAGSGCTEVDGATLLCETATETRLPPRAPTDAYDAVPWLLPAPCPAVRPGRRNAPSDCPPYRPPDTLPGLSDGAVRFQHT
jgi:hypothetical protein